MKAIIAQWAVELRHHKNTPTPYEDLVGLAQLALLALQRLHPAATSLGTPAREPLSISTFFTHSCSVWPAQPIFAAIDTTAASAT